MAMLHCDVCNQDVAFPGDCSKTVPVCSVCGSRPSLVKYYVGGFVNGEWMYLSKVTAGADYWSESEDRAWWTDEATAQRMAQKYDAMVFAAW